jgi:general secretion pathway protein C
MGRLGIRIANVLLASLCCFQVASVVNKISAGALVGTVEPTYASPSASPEAARRFEDHAVILARNLFGAQILGATALPVEPEPEPELEETKLPVQLLGTLLSGDPSKSTAAITERGAPEPELLHEGDRLARHQQASVARIERGRVILQNGARREELLLSEEPLDTPSRVAASPTARRSSRLSRTRAAPTRSATPSPASLTEQLKEMQLGGADFSGAQDLFSQARITPKWEAGQMTGMEVRDIVPGSLYDKIGLADGDVIESLNGVKLDSTAAGAKVLSEFGEAETFEIVLSDGTVKTLRSDEIPALLDDGGANVLPGADEQ